MFRALHSLKGRFGIWECRSVIYNPCGILLSGMQKKLVLTEVDYFDLRVPSCTDQKCSREAPTGTGDIAWDASAPKRLVQTAFRYPKASGAP